MADRKGHSTLGGFKPQPTRTRTHAQPTVKAGKPEGARAKPKATVAPLVRKQPVQRARKPSRVKIVGHGRAPRRLHRMVAVIVVLILALTGVAVKVGAVQLSDQQKAYEAAGDRQRGTSSVQLAERGAIYDRDGVFLAVSVPSYSVWADPKYVVDVPGTLSVLAAMLGYDSSKVEKVAALFAVPGKRFVYLSRQVSPDLKDSLLALEMPGIYATPDETRILPGGSSAINLLGRTDIDGVGSGGLEYMLNDQLAGQAGKTTYQRAEDGSSIPGSENVVVQAVAGQDVVLTIDSSLQYLTERILIKQVTALKAKGATAIIMDSATGNILVAASVVLDLETGLAHVNSANAAVTEIAEPGSVAKVVTTAGAIDAGTVTPDTYFEVPYEKKFYDEVLQDAAPHATENMSVGKIFAKSSNIGTIFISQSMGAQNQEYYMRQFGFGSKTSLNFRGESAGILKPFDQWQGVENVTVAYGQGVATTSMQLISAVNVIANGGVYVGPRLVESVGGVSTAPSPTHVAVKPETAATMTTLLKNVVCEGTATRAQIDGYNIAGKTGTGLKARDGVYEDANGVRAYYASFVGFLPAENPAITILVSIDEPPASGDHYGGLVAAPVFKEIAQAAVIDLQIPSGAKGGCGAT